MPAAPAQTTTPPPATAPPLTPEPVDVTPVTPEPVPEPEPTAIVTPEIAPPPPDDPPVTQPTTASDEAAIRRVLDDFARATETKDVELYRSVRPISTEEERRLRSGFDAVETQQVELLIESIEITGDRASVQGSRQDTFVGAVKQTVAGRQGQDIAEGLRLVDGRKAVDANFVPQDRTLDAPGDLPSRLGVLLSETVGRA